MAWALKLVERICFAAFWIFAGALLYSITSCTIENANFSVQGAQIHQEPAAK
jgi:hypothetical protein